MLEPVQHSSVPDLVFAELSQAILAGRYGPGERLPSQRTLARELGVNIAGVREALGRLEQLRLVEVRQGEPMRVLDWRESGGLEALAMLGSFDPAVIAALFEARRLLLSEAAALAAQRRTGEQAARIGELAKAVAVAADDTVALLADWAFMAAVIEAAGNLVFQLIMNSVRELYLPNAAAFTAVVSDRRKTARHYEAGAAAIAAGDPAAAREAIAALAAAQESSMGSVLRRER
jgi:GntR family transcriptional repressor for pyruvate dehydrogenase complex